jgi:hypothetical protein
VLNEIEQWVVAKCRLIAIPLVPHGGRGKTTSARYPEIMQRIGLNEFSAF